MVELLDMKLHKSATRPFLYRVFHERWKCHTRNCMKVRRSQFIPDVSWMAELLDTKLHDSATRRGLYRVFKCMMELLDMNLFPREVTVTWKKLNARIAGLNADRITFVSHVLYVRSENWCCVCLCEYSNSTVPWQDFIHEIFKIRPRITHSLQDVDTSWNVMAHGDAREGKWRGNWRMEWVASTLYTTSEHGISSITTADAHTSAVSSRLNWRPPPI